MSIYLENSGLDPNTIMLESTPLSKVLEERNKRFLEHYPEFKIQLPEDNSQEPEYEPKGKKYFSCVGAPEGIVVKDKKVLVAEEKLSKEESPLHYRQLVSAVRARAKQSLREDKRRIFKNGLLRAYGLYLWEMEREDGPLNSKRIRSFRDIVDSIYTQYGMSEQEGSRDVEDENYIYENDKELKKLTKNTGSCILKGDYLNIL